MLYATKPNYGHVIDIESHAKDGRLAGPSDGKVFDYEAEAENLEWLRQPVENIS